MLGTIISNLPSILAIVCVVLAFIVWPTILFVTFRIDKKRKTDYEYNIKETEESHMIILNRTKMDYEKQLSDMHYKELSYDEVNQIIEDIINDIWTNRYFMHYTLKDASVIPNMDEDIANITKDVCEAIGDNIWVNIRKYYKADYFIQKITRRATILCMDYIKQHKPPSK